MQFSIERNRTSHLSVSISLPAILSSPMCPAVSWHALQQHYFHLCPYSYKRFLPHNKCLKRCWEGADWAPATLTCHTGTSYKQFPLTVHSCIEYRSTEPLLNRAEAQTHRVHILVEMKQGQCICPLSLSVHCNFTGEGKCNERGWACTPHPHQPGLILPSSLNERQKAAVATLCTLCSDSMAKLAVATA